MLIFSSIVDTDIKRLLPPIIGNGYKDRDFDSIKPVGRLFHSLYVCVTNY